MIDIGDAIEAAFAGIIVILTLTAMSSYLPTGEVINIELLARAFRFLFAALVVLFVISIFSEAAS